MFVSQPNGFRIVVGPYSRGIAIQHAIEPGDAVMLRLPEDAVYVTDVEVLGPDLYRGRVEFFENSPEMAIGDVAMGQLVEFEQHHVLACHKRCV